MTHAKDLSALLSAESKSRKNSPLKGLMGYRQLPGMRSLGNGLPIADLFPFDDLQVKMPAYPFREGVLPSSESSIEMQDIHIQKVATQNDRDIPLESSLQYGMSKGDAKLLNFIREHMSRLHTMQYDDWDVILSVGNTFGWYSILHTFTSRGDVILCEKYSFPSSLEAARAEGVHTVRVETDLEGIVPEALETQLANWVGPRPKLLYTIPTGQNPTGSCLSAERREKVYKIAQKYDMIIVEDEPYYYLQFSQYVHERSRVFESEITEVVPLQQEVDAMVDSFVPSFLQIDVDGRVVRLDSFSKLVAPGTRLSWITAQKKFVERLHRMHEVTVQGCSGFSSSIVYGLLQRWGQVGYWSWIYKLKNVYSRFRDIACDTIYDHFPAGKYEFVPPVAGMFYWLRIDSRKYKGYLECEKDPRQCEIDLWKKAVDKKVLLAPGHWFISEEKKGARSESDYYAMHFRGTFAGVKEELLRATLADFGALLDASLID